MAAVRIQGNELCVTLSALEKVGALSGEVRVPLSSVEAVRVAPSAYSGELRGLRVGTGLPFVVVLGRMFHRDGVDFVAVYGTRRALAIDLARGQRYRRIVVTGVGDDVVEALRAHAAAA